MRSGYPQVLIDGVYYYEHRLVAEKMLGRPLYDTEVVHHIDMDRTNNTSTNLVVLTQLEHKRLHKHLEHTAALVLLRENRLVFNETTKRYELVE